MATPLRRLQAAAEPPLRSALYSADQMERHGEALALAHKLRPGRARDLLLRRLTKNEGVLVAAGELLKAAVVARHPIAPAGEWLLDNFHLIEEQLRTAKRHLPKAYSRELPRLLEGPSAGLPRAYDIALEAIWAAMAFAELGDSRRAWELFAMINPVNHAKSAAGVATYKVEPYVMAADVYAAAPHTGRGGWTWYTGSAGWMYRLALESLLGLRLEGDKLRLAPCLPASWPGFKLRYRYRDTLYRIAVVRDESGSVEHSDHVIPLVDDRGEHFVEVRCRTA